MTLASLPKKMALECLVFEAKMCWRIERDYQDLIEPVCSTPPIHYETGEQTGEQ